MVLPTKYQMDAAIQVLELVGVEGTSLKQLRQSYPRVASGGLFDSRTLQRAEALAAQLGALVVSEDGSCGLGGLPDPLGLESLSRFVGTMMMIALPQPWLRTAVGLDAVRWEFVPTDATDLLSYLLPDPVEREAALMAAARVFDESARKRVGRIAEEHVEKECKKILASVGRSDLASRVTRVSAVSDELGYDIASPDMEGQPRFLEVKGTTSGHPRFFISRNEFMIGTKYESWALVICHVFPEGESEILGWCNGATLLGLAPTDNVPTTRWENARITLASHHLSPGLPILF